MLNSQTPSRSSSRANNRSNPPGVLAVTSSMLANANHTQSPGQSGSPAASKAKRSTNKAASAQRRLPSSAEPVDCSDIGGETSNARADGSANEAGRSDALVSGSGSTADASTPANNHASPSKRRGKKKSAMARPDDLPASRSALINAGYATSDIDDTADATPAGQKRPQHKRGVSANNISFASSPVVRPSALPEAAAQQSRQADIDVERALQVPSDSEPATLSRSAPASSFLEGAHQSSRKSDGKRTKSSNPQKDTHQPIRSSNSADEWDMPSAKLIQGNDVLTWQQQASVPRSASQNKKPGNSNRSAPNSAANTTFQLGKKQTVAAQQASHSNSTPASGLSNAMAAGAAAADSGNGQVSPALTWQQALLQRSAPATPATSNIFDALEQGHTGARPAPDHSHHRTRSSPAKSVRNIAPFKATAAHPRSEYSSGDDDGRLHKQLNNMSMINATIPVQTGQPKVNAKRAKPIPINPAGSSEQRSAAPVEPDVRTSSNAVFPAPAEVRQTKSAAATPIAMGTNSSPTKSSLYAGPKFHNSPSAGQLPTPKLAAFLNRNREASPATQAAPAASSPSSEAIFA